MTDKTCPFCFRQKPCECGSVVHYTSADMRGDDVQPLTDDENADLLDFSTCLWKALDENELGGFSDYNRPIYLRDMMRDAIERFGHRNTGWKVPGVHKAIGDRAKQRDELLASRETECNALAAENLILRKNDELLAEAVAFIAKIADGKLNQVTAAWKYEARDVLSRAEQLKAKG